MCQPSTLTPMKAVLTDERFSDPNWIYERKYDGIRCLAFREEGKVRLMSRNARDITGEFPEVARAMDAEPTENFIADGELVAFKGRQTSFQLLQQRWREHVKVYLYVFDLPYFDCEDLTKTPLRDRKARLRRNFAFQGEVRYAQHRIGDGVAYYQQACKKGWEGVIAKRADSRYVQKRSRDWLKFKCSNEQEFVIGGFTAPKGSRTDFGALLVGYYEDGKLIYAGKVGTGFDHETLHSLGEQLMRLERDTPPFESVEPMPRSARWVEPVLVAQIGFSEWTRDGRLRHPRFLGLRDDKPAHEVVRETPS